MSGRRKLRRLFVLSAGVVLVLLLLALVVAPAIERGGVWELVVVALIALAVLLVERWLRTR